MMKYILCVICAFLFTACDNNPSKPVDKSGAIKQAELVTLDNFAQIETAIYFDKTIQQSGGLNRWSHLRQPTPLDAQNVIRMNRDTLYSMAVIDIRKEASITIPDAGERYMSVQVVNQDHYTNAVFHAPGKYDLLLHEHKTPYVFVIARIFANPNDADDLKTVNQLQDQLMIQSNSTTPYIMPEFDMVGYKTVKKHLLEKASHNRNARATFGKREDVDPDLHILGAAFGWGGLPEHEAFYQTIDPNLSLGAYEIHIDDKIPVNGFWSITVYNENGFIEPNDLGVYNIRPFKFEVRQLN